MRVRAAFFAIRTRAACVRPALEIIAASLLDMPRLARSALYVRCRVRATYPYFPPRAETTINHVPRRSPVACYNTAMHREDPPPIREAPHVTPMDDLTAYDVAACVALATSAWGIAGLIGALVTGYVLRLLTDPARYRSRHR